jgi:hypothetical protein
MAVVKATPLEIRWSAELPIFASEAFLQCVGDQYGWIGGIDESGVLRCILPYTIVSVSGFRMVRFRVETIALKEDFNVDEEREFLTLALSHLRTIGADVVIPASTNTIFRTYPAGSDAAPYGSYVIDLCQEEEAIWRSIAKVTRQNISTAEKSGMHIRSGIEYLDVSYVLIRNTFARSKLPFMSRQSLERFVQGLGNNGKILVADYQGVIHSCVIYAFSEYCAYCVYAGNIPNQHQGASKLIHWEAMRLFRNSGVRRYDFVGARIDPEKGSKQEALNSFKKHLGGKLRQGYMWKYPLHPMKSFLYSIGIRLLRGGDIVDLERNKLKTIQAEQGFPLKDE